MRILGQKPKNLRIDPNYPRARARDDFSGFIVTHDELRQQMEFRGNSLEWTGFYVHPRFMDKPNPQLMSPLVIPDPVPIPYPRPDPLPLNYTPPTPPADPVPPSFPAPYPVVKFPGLN